MRTYIFIAMLLTSFFYSNSAFAEEDTCIKKVFHKYCLGGDEKDLPEWKAKQKISDKSYVYQYTKILAVQTFSGRISRVVNFYGRYTWLKYLTLTNKLKEKYGEPKDNSYFPDYVKTPQSKVTTITIGKSEIIHSWQQDGWSIIFVWSEGGAGLSYSHDSLIEQEKASSPDEGL